MLREFAAMEKGREWSIWSGVSWPSSEQFAVALYQRLALEGRKWFAELISACFPHAKNELGVRAFETPHEQGVVAEVLL